MTKVQQHIPPVAGEDIASLARWARQVSGVMNEFMRRASTGAIFVWDEGCINVPTNTTIAGAHELIFESPFFGGFVGNMLTEDDEEILTEGGENIILESSNASNYSLIVTGIGFDGDVHVALNDYDLGALSADDTENEVLYEIQADTLQQGLNSFKVWSDSGEATELRRLEVWRNFVKGDVNAAGQTAVWGSVTGVGKPEDDADVTQDHAAEVVVLSAGLPASPKAGWLVYLTAAAGGFAANTWVRRNDDNDEWVKVGAHDALQLLNPAEEAGANKTETRTANDVETGGGRNVEEQGADKTTRNLELIGDSDTNPVIGQDLGTTDSTSVFAGSDWEPLRTFTTDFKGTFRLMVEAREVDSGTGGDPGGWRLKNGAGTVVHTDSTLTTSFVETFSDEETVTDEGETWTIEAHGSGDGAGNGTQTEIRDTEVRARFNHATFS